VSDQLAEELLQMFRASRPTRRLRPDTDLRAWLFVAPAPQPPALGVVGRAKPLSRTAAPPAIHRTSCRGTETGRIVGALATMPDGNREVAVLVWIERLEPAQAAAVLGVNPDAVRQRLARARKWVSDALERGAT
jgi:DNA-directed RNA polymerase specialized sigma24 family protein